MAKKGNWVRGVVLGLIIVLSPMVYRYVKPMILGPDIEKVRVKMEKYLYKKYGEEFIVDRIGIRSAVGKKFYQARIYPKSIIGTEKEGDKYYYASSSANILPFGRIDEPGDSYSFIKRNDDVEKYLLPKAKGIFGNRIKLKVDVKHEVTAHLDYKAKPEDLFWGGYKSSSLKEMREDVSKDPEHERIVLELYIYLTG